MGRPIARIIRPPSARPPDHTTVGLAFARGEGLVSALCVLTGGRWAANDVATEIAPPLLADAILSWPKRQARREDCPHAKQGSSTAAKGQKNGLTQTTGTEKHTESTEKEDFEKQKIIFLLFFSVSSVSSVVIPAWPRFGAGRDGISPSIFTTPPSSLPYLIRQSIPAARSGPCHGFAGQARE